jgi:hypothetical protein
MVYSNTKNILAFSTQVIANLYCKTGLTSGAVLSRWIQGWAGPVATLVPEKGDSLSGPYLSYYTATTPGHWKCRKTGVRRVASHHAVRCRAVHAEVERKVAGSSPARGNFYHLSRTSPALKKIEDLHLCLFLTWCDLLLNCKTCGNFTMNVVFSCNFTSENIMRKRVILKKKNILRTMYYF